MTQYLGSFPIDINDTPYKGFTKEDWILYFIERYGQIDGGHHKAWVLDQVARILHDTPIVIEEAKWSDGETELRVMVGAPSETYNEWVLMMKGFYDKEYDEYEYDYEEGIAP